MALHGELGELFANAALALLKQESLTANDVLAIGSHGQTVYHQPLANPPATLQLGNAAIIAARTGIDTVADFRVADMAHGGQGAPLAPLLHQRLFANLQADTAVLNLGGIANLTLLPADGEPQGYDTGPANTFIDGWIRQQQSKAFDNHGDWGRSGSVNRALLNALLDEPYFAAAAPKSTGTDYFSTDWLAEKTRRFASLQAADIQATLTELTAVTVADSLRLKLPHCQTLLVCGGGALNSYLLERLQSLLGITVQSTGDHGFHPQWLEGILFGWLAYRRLKNLPGNVPTATGARRRCLLGAIYPAG